MNYKHIYILVLLYLFSSCSQDTQKNDIATAGLFVEKIHHAFCVNDESEFKTLLINKEKLIQTLIDEKKQIVFQYDSVFFNMATTDKEYTDYQNNILKEFYKIKKTSGKNNLDWYGTSLQKVTYYIDSLQINLKGILIIKDKLQQQDSICFEAIKLQNNWTLTKLY